jgi:hypothetical protein
MINRQSNPFAAMTIIVLIAILFMAYWVAIPIYGEMSEIFHDDSSLVNLTTATACTSSGHYWIVDGSLTYCSHLSVQARQSIKMQRRAWLIAPFIFAVSLIIWYFTKSTSRDLQQWQQ